MLHEVMRGEARTYVPAEVTSAYPLPPYAFRGSRMCTALVRVDTRDLVGVLPQHLYPVAGMEDVVTVSFNRLAVTESDIRPYNELVIGMPAVLRTPARQVAGHYMIQTFLGSVGAESAVSPIMAGQLVYGMPKREGEFTVDGNFDDAVSIKVVRHGIVVVDADIVKRDEPAHPSAVARVVQDVSFYLKAIPNVQGSGWDVLQLTGQPLEPAGRYAVHDCRIADITFADDRITLDTGRVLRIKEVLTGTYFDVDFALGWRGVVHDYLAD